MKNQSAAVPDGDQSATLRKGKSVGAVVNASQILRFLQATRSPATATQISRDLKMNPSTCFNILRTLIDEDFVDFDNAGKTYTLSLGVVALARGALEQNAGLRTLQPKLQELTLKHGILSVISRRISKDRSVLVAVAESDAPIRIHGRPGTSSPLLLGATGRVYAAYSHFSEAELEERFSQLRLARPLDFQTFLSQVAEVRQTGWAIDDGYYYPGTVSLAAPVFNADGTVTLCCSTILFNGQYDPKRLMSIAMELVDICKSGSSRSHALEAVSRGEHSVSTRKTHRSTSQANAEAAHTGAAKS